MIDETTALEAHDVTREQLFKHVGIACFVVCIAWLVQVLAFNGIGTIGKVVWIILAAIVAGMGVAFIGTPYYLSRSGGLK